jgi:type IV secretion system protein VirD4
MIILIVILFIAATIYSARKEWLNEQKKKTQHGTARWANRREAAALSRRRGIYIGESVCGPAFFGKDGHAVTISPAGTGKGTCLAIPNLLEWRNSTFVFDTKGEAAATTAKDRRGRGHRVICLNGWGLHTQWPWRLPQDSINVLDELDPAGKTFLDDCDWIASLCIHRTGHEGGNSVFFKNAAQQALGRGYIAFCKTFEPPERQNLLTIHEYVNASEEGRQALWDAMKTCGNPTISAEAYALEDSFENAAAQFSAVHATMKEATDWLSSEAMQNMLRSSSFSFDELKNGGTDIFCVIPAERLQTHSALLRLTFAMAARAMMRAPYAKKPVLFLLDEAAQLGKLDLLASGMALLRGYNAFLWPFFQNLGQIRSLYGEQAQTFLANAAVRIFLSVQDLETAQLVSQMCGVSTLEFEEEDARGERVTVYRPRELIKPDEVLHFPADEAFVFVQNEPTFRMKKVPYFQRYWPWRYQRNPFYD